LRFGILNEFICAGFVEVQTRFCLVKS
jgi:hypothetical protein